MRFTVFGIPTEVQFSFWLGAVLLGFEFITTPFILFWMAIVFISVLVHELGHAIAIRACSLRPEISLQWLGGLTSWSGSRDLSRPKRILISFAGPLAGFLLAGAVWALQRYFPGLVAAPEGLGRIGAMIPRAVQYMMLVNVAWGVINLVPVLPLDGGHILGHALGPKRTRLAAGLSATFGALAAALALWLGQVWLGFLFGMLGLQSFQLFQVESPDPARRRAPTEEVDVPVPFAITRELDRASEALADDRLAEARTLAEAVLVRETELPRRGRIRALEIVAWSQLLANALDDAARTMRALQREGRADAALLGGLLKARGDVAAARAVYESARAMGDDRKEVVGPLIQLLIEQGEIPRAAATALDIVDSLNDDDVRRMAELASEHRSFGWAGRLHAALYDRSPNAEAAFASARARALEGDVPGAFTWLRRAREAGFADADRVWSDAAFEAVRAARADQLQDLLPRP